MQDAGAAAQFEQAARRGRSHADGAVANRSLITNRRLRFAFPSIILSTMRAVNIIRRKRDGHALDGSEIDAFVRGVTSGEWPDYQAAALLMAIVLRGMNAHETAHLTRAMVDSGARLDWSNIPGPKVDKHSTGGVGDKTSLILAP